MNIDIIFKLAGIGLITSIVNQILKYCGKEEIASITTLAGLVICLLMVLNLIKTLFENVKGLFSI
ncbi:MAG: stage III sporulation protein AC [Clostridia bacterium]|nr:stage III sporulation protein AC [Clostridia bacterium]